MGKPTIANLIAQAGKQLRSDFEHARVTVTHAASKGAEVEAIIRTFLDQHLPQRFRPGSGVIIDNGNNLSKQIDVIVYDALSSPLYRFSEQFQIVPVDAVASVIAVKTALSKKQLADGYENIASCKQLAKRPLTDMDRTATGSHLSTLGTLGVIFGFDSEISLEKLAEHAVELNSQYESNLWPDMIVVLDEGIVSYAYSFPGETTMAAMWAPPLDKEFVIPPMYVSLFIYPDKEFTLNRFFLMLLSHLTFYPYRVSTPPFDVMLQGTSEAGLTVTGYQFDRARKLRPVAPEQYIGKSRRRPLMISIAGQDGTEVGLLQFIPWQDGSVIRMIGGSAQWLKNILSEVLIGERQAMVIPRAGVPETYLSSVLSVTEEEFKQWPQRISRVFGMNAQLTP